MAEHQPRKASFSFTNQSAVTSIALALMLGLAVTITAAPAAQAQTFQVLHNFTNGLDGANPYTGLTMDRAGNLYGTAEHGGSQANDCHIVNGCGTVFELAHQGAGFIFRPLYQFQGFPSGDGANPQGRVIFGPDGALYGTTSYGGQNGEGCGNEMPGCGIVFKLSPQPTFCKSFTCNWQETRIYNFSGPSDGDVPRGEIAFDAAGNLYGATELNGPGGWGTAYELTPAHDTWTLTILHGFEERLDGANPMGGVQLDQAGNVYGTTNIGGDGEAGTAFQLVPSGSGWTLNILTDFNYNSGGFALLAGLIVGPETTSTAPLPTEVPTGLPMSSVPRTVVGSTTPSMPFLTSIAVEWAPTW